MLHRKARLISFCAAIAAAIFAPGGPAVAQIRDVFAVRAVAVDARAADELKAKSAGIAEAQRRALRRLLERLTLRADYDRLPETDDRALAQMLRDYSVDNEKFGGGRYLATLTVRFKPAAVRALLRGADIPFAETASRPVLVLPVFRNAGSTILWDDPNPWFAAWSRLPRSDGLLPLIAPVGDLSDVSVISAEQAVRGEADRLADIARKYNAHGVLVAVATLRVNPGDGALSLEVSASRIGGANDETTTVRSFTAGAEEARDALLDRAAKTLADEAEEAWKRENLLARDVEQRIEILIPLGGLTDWLAIRKRLRAIAGVRRVDVTRLSIGRAEVALRYVGSATQLRLAMAQSNLTMTYAPAQATWTLRLERGR